MCVCVCVCVCVYLLQRNFAHAKKGKCIGITVRNLFVI